jgi:hypothetical protein
VCIERLSSQSEREYIHFLHNVGARSAAALAYHHPSYLRTLCQVLGCEDRTLILRDAHTGNIIAALPGLLKRSDAGAVYNSLPFFGPNAGVMSTDPSYDAVAHQQLLNHALEIASREAAWSAVFYTPLFFNDFALYDQNVGSAAVVVEKFTQWLHLPDSPNWSAKLKYDLRKADASGVRVVKDVSSQQLGDLWWIYLENCRDYGIPAKPRQFLDTLIAGVSTIYSTYVATVGEQVVAGLIVLWGPRTVSYFLPCTRHDFRSLQPSTALIDAAIRDAIQRGVDTWNWESSPSRESGVYQFKKKWGSVEQNYRIYVVPFRDERDFVKLGRERIVENFPYFFAYPFDRLSERIHDAN